MLFREKLAQFKETSPSSGKVEERLRHNEEKEALSDVILETNMASKFDKFSKFNYSNIFLTKLIGTAQTLANTIFHMNFTYILTGLPL